MNPLLQINRSQRILLVVVACVIGLFQLEYFRHNDMDGYGWIFSVLVIAALLYFALITNHLAAAPVTAPASIKDLAAQDVTAISHGGKNIDIISLFTKRMEADLCRNAYFAPDISPERLRVYFMIYAFALLTIGKARHSSDFFSTDEYRITKEQVLWQAMKSHKCFLEETTGEVTQGQKVIIALYTTEIATVEEGVKDFFDQLNRGNHDMPAFKINQWLNERTKISEVVGDNLEAFTKSNVKEICNMISKLPGHNEIQD